MSIQNVIDFEEKYLNMLHQGIKRLGKISQEDEGLEMIYAAFVRSFQKAAAEMDKLKSELSQAASRPLLPMLQASGNASLIKRRERPAKKLLCYMRCNLPRPSQVFNAAMAEEKQILFIAFEEMLADPNLDDAYLEEHIDAIGQILCDLPIADPQRMAGDGESIWPKVITGVSGLAAGWFGKSMWDKYSSGAKT